MKIARKFNIRESLSNTARRAVRGSACNNLLASNDLTKERRVRVGPAAGPLLDIVFHIILSDIILAQECETNCGSDLYACVQECGSNTECSSACYRENVVCVDSCPCHTG